MQLMAWKNDYPPASGARGYSSCWSYIHADGREYAAIGVYTGTAIYNVTDPGNTYRVAFIPGPVSVWREMKSYRQWIYVVTEGVGPSPAPGVQIVRMTDPEHPVLAATWTGVFVRCHTVSVDTTRALLICNGARNASGYETGMHILSIANPESPVELSVWPGGILWSSVDSMYVHDSVPVGNRLYACSIYPGIVRVLDISNPAAPTQITWFSYPGGFTHNAWTDRTGRFLYVTDEVKGEPLKVFDLTNVDAPVMVNRITSNPQAAVHNAYVAGDELYLASFTEGVRVLDISDPAHPAEFAWADSWPYPEGPFYSMWGVCPYFPSGTVIGSDMESGLYVYRPVRDYGIVRVRVVDAATAQPVSDAMVTLTAQGDSLTTPADGIVQFAPSPGSHAVFARKFGYGSASASVVVGLGSRDTVVLALDRFPTVYLHGTVTGSDTHLGLDDAEVTLEATPLLAHADPTGSYGLEPVPAGVYEVEVHRPGYAPATLERSVGPGLDMQDFDLNPARTWDALEAESGWTVGAPGDDETSGRWVRVVPAGAGGQVGSARAVRAHAEHDGEPALYPNRAQPDRDRTPGAGTMCFVTGQGTDPDDVWQADVSGKTTLISPPLDLTGMTVPAIGWWQWFYSDGDYRDWLAVSISNDGGSTWVGVDTTRGMRNHWEEGAVHVSDHLTPTNRMRLRFTAADLGVGSIVEAAIDDIVTYDAGLPVTGAGPGSVPARLAFRAPWPNPAQAAVRLVLDVPRAGDVLVEIFDVSGRRLRTLHRGSTAAGPLSLVWDGTDQSGQPAKAGVYEARAGVTGVSARARVVWLR